LEKNKDHVAIKASHHHHDFEKISKNITNTKSKEMEAARIRFKTIDGVIISE